MEKFQIYFKLNNLENYTLSISRIDKETDTYKLKIIYSNYNQNTLQTEKIKIREFHLGAKDILNKLSKIDFKKKYTFDKNKESYYQICYGENKLITSNKKEIINILEDFNFIEIIHITPKEYKYIKNIYEYINLKKIFLKECSKLSSDNIEKIIKAFDNNNPYEIFEHISYIEKYCNDL